MAYKLEDINFRTVADPKGFVEQSDAIYLDRVKQAAERIAANLGKSPIVLLSGPSGSGKTTTSMKLSEALGQLGINTHYLSMDSYYRNIDETYPRTAEGKPDYEAPSALDIALIDEHLAALARGEEIAVPRYDFANSVREEGYSKLIRLRKDEVLVMEGIHALNDLITDSNNDALKIYIAPESDVTFRDEVVFKHQWFRLVRRCIRDHNFRGTDAAKTMASWANVRRGEKLYISPCKHKADIRFDTSLPYELPLMRRSATEHFRTIPEGIERYDELRAVLPALQLVGDIDETLVPKNALVREFIGGGVYEY